MAASFSSTCRAIGKVLSFQEGTAFVNSNSAATKHLGEEMLEARKNFYLSLAFGLTACAAYLLSENGPCVQLFSHLASSTDPNQKMKESCLRTSACILPILAYTCAFVAIEGFRHACYLHHLHAIESPEDPNIKGALQETLLKISMFVNQFIPGPLEYLFGPPINVRELSTLPVALTIGIFSSLLGASIFWFDSAYFAKYPTDLPNCTTSYLFPVALYALVCCPLDLLATANRVRIFIEQESAQNH